jgi:hydroxyisourate hydrolase
VTRITTHVLDTAAGRPAAGIPVALEVLAGVERWTALGSAVTDRDGRTAALAEVGAGPHRLRFDVAAHLGAAAFFSEVTVGFEVDPERDGDHLHVPLLLSPFGYTTYRGS